MKSMTIFAGMVGVHNAEEMGLHEACETETGNGEEMGLFLPLGSCTIFLHVTSKHKNGSCQWSRSRNPFEMR
jgi:hypothetical protein